MTKLVESIAKSLVEHPEAVSVTEADDGRNSVLQLKVAADDMGKIIGKQGRIAKALRTVVKAAATKQNKKVVVEIVSENE
ncbi:MAG: KH domain-containing protein [Emergencia sp.]|nr:KH domain-containing protein [Emergencia sp.]